jgi:hypothetical protein
MGQHQDVKQAKDQIKLQFRHQGKLVEAVQYDGTSQNAEILCDFAGRSVDVQGYDGHFGNAVSVRLVTPFGSRLLFPTDWVVSNGRGSYVAMNDSVFAQQHEQIGES